jgi:hypothetical protein
MLGIAHNTCNVQVMNILAYIVLLIYVITAWSRVLFEKLTSSQQVKKFPAFYETGMFITAFTSARHLAIS